MGLKSRLQRLNIGTDSGVKLMSFDNGQTLQDVGGVYHGKLPKYRRLKDGRIQFADGKIAKPACSFSSLPFRPLALQSAAIPVERGADCDGQA